IDMYDINICVRIFFFFQAEDGIRDRNVTGVQTCALPISEIKEIVKGGLVVDVGLRGFIPASLVETYFVEDFSDYKNQILKVKIVDLNKEQNRVILSHRAVVEEEAAKKKRERLQM